VRNGKEENPFCLTDPDLRYKLSEQHSWRGMDEKSGGGPFIKRTGQGRREKRRGFKRWGGGKKGGNDP